MNSPLLAAAMAVAFLLASPMVGKSLADTIDASGVTAPLICAMAHNGACNGMVASAPAQTAAG